jgi:SAM-dependent methyltransferase
MYSKIPKSFNPPLRNPYYFVKNELLKKVSQYSNNLNGKLLDFGCGEKPYKSLFSNVTEYVGLDFENPGHSHEKEQIDLFYDGKKIPFGNNYFDSILSTEVFEHVFNLDELLPELNRVLKTSGKILITCPFVWAEHETPHDYARYTKFALQDKLEKNGFKILVIDKTGDFAMALHQMKLVFFSEQLLPSMFFIGKFKVITSNIRPILVFLKNSWFLLKHKFLPKRDCWYLNNVIVAEKI